MLLRQYNMEPTCENILYKGLNRIIMIVVQPSIVVNRMVGPGKLRTYQPIYATCSQIRRQSSCC